ncbi:MAG: NAD(P)-dependent oxidoreductase [Hyphomicrobiaceae bacterium]|nr:NAD(P)-dependent oxidoreductase [Hyphomicrobiaceae bacterium]
MSNLPILLVTLEADPASRHVIEAEVAGAAQVVYLADLPAAARAGALASAAVLLSRNTAKELAAAEPTLLAGARLVQFVTAGVDYVPLADFPPGLAVAANGGAYAEPMAEHALAMTLAALKRLPVEHEKLARREFDQFRSNRMLAGSVVGILGFGGIGIATARLMRALGARVHAVNRSGRTDEPVDWIGTEKQLPALLAASDVLLLSLPLTPATNGLIGAAELVAMKPDAVLVNLARGEIVDEAALFAHLQAHPGFTACIDAWWVEPVRHGRFEMGHDFTSLPNVIASPHNSASVKDWRHVALRRAVGNARRALVGERPANLVPPADRMQ